jgi:hypothetical protein
VEIDSFGAISGLGDDLKVRDGAQQGYKPLPDDMMIVDH